MALPHLHKSDMNINKSGFSMRDPEDDYAKKARNQAGAAKGPRRDDDEDRGQAAGVMTLQQRLAARREAETGVKSKSPYTTSHIPSGDGLNRSVHGGADAKFQKVNLIGSMMNEHAVFSLVTQTDDITYLDLRGNGLDSAFGWKLIKALKKQYLKLDFVNGVDTKAIRNNAITDLNLTGFLSHNGLFGIEPVGAIFLAHFLRTNTSLLSIQFQRNQVGKDGSKAIAQSLIGNTHSQVNEVNQMKPIKKRGVHFAKFKTGDVKEIRMANFNLVDEDAVFLEEYLSRHDCTEELMLAGNFFFGEGIRKFGRYLGVTKTLKELRLGAVPVSFDGIQLLTKGIASNESLIWIQFPIGVAYGPSKELLQVMHQLAVAVARHPTLERWGATPVRVDYLKQDNMGEYNLMRLLNTGYHYDVALFFWVLATCKPPSKTDLMWNPTKGDPHEYPSVKLYNPALLLAISSAAHQMRGHLSKVHIAICENMTGVAQLLYYLAGSTTLKEMVLPGYANAKISFEELPKEWNEEGKLPLWYRQHLTTQRRLWDALWGFVSQTKNLEKFNAVMLKEYTDHTELQVMLMFECQKYFVGKKEEGDEITLNFGNDCAPEFPFEATRLLTKPYDINLEFVGKNQTKIKTQQDIIAQLIVAKPDGKGPAFPAYMHRLHIKNQPTSKQMINTMEYSPCLEDIYVESVENVLSVLVKSLCTAKSRENLKGIKVNRFWMPQRKIPKRYSDKQLERLKMLHDWMKRSSRFETVFSTIEGEVNKAAIQEQSLHQFGITMSGLRITEIEPQPTYKPSVCLEIFHDIYDYFYPPAADDEEEEGGPKQIFMILPLHQPKLTPGPTLKTIHLCMAHLKDTILTMYPDQYPDSCKRLWAHPNARVKLGEENIAELDENNNEYDYEEYLRFHWDKDVSVGTAYNRELLSKVYLTENRKDSRGFHNDVVYLILKSLMESPALNELDIRGNGFEADDMKVIIDLLPESNITTINAIPVAPDDDLHELNFDAGPVVLPEDPDERPEIDEYADPEYAASIGACQAWRGLTLDEGDTFLIRKLVTSDKFPGLSRMAFLKHNIQEAAMLFLCDTFVHLKGLSDIVLDECVLSNRSSNLLVNTVSDMSTQLTALNGIGVGGRGESSDTASWSDLNLGVFGRKNQWSDLKCPAEQETLVIDRTISDSGLRGLSSFIRWNASNKLSNGMPKLQKVDFAYNLIISDAVIAEFCRSLLMPSAAPDLEEIDCRYCPSLKARSAFELHHLVQRDVDGMNGSVSKLKVINGMNVNLLIESSIQRKATAPLVIRMHAGALEDLHSDVRAPKVLSESDSHFFAHCLHMFPNIPHCHLHLVVTAGEMEEPLKNYRVPGIKTGKSNFSPFIIPETQKAIFQNQLSIAESFFQACPVSTRLQLSISPKPDIFYFREANGKETPGDDLVLLPPVSGSKSAAKSDSIFGATVRGVLRAKQRARARAEEAGELDPDEEKPQKPLYVNNINSQRMHNQYRSLYGFDDIDILEKDIHNENYASHRFVIPADCDLSNLYSVVSSLDIQHMGLTMHHMINLVKATQSDLDLGMLTHLNLNNNNLTDRGVAKLMEAFSYAGSSIVHLTLAGNLIGDEGAKHIANNLYSLQRLTSLCVSHNCIRETGAIYLANAIGGRREGEFIPLLSMDFSHNYCRELGAERWAKILMKHQTLQFFNYSFCELAYTQSTYFLALIYAFMQSPSLAVLDLGGNFQGEHGEGVDPPEDVLEALTQDIPQSMFDPKEVEKGVFIRRNKKPSPTK